MISGSFSPGHPPSTHDDGKERKANEEDIKRFECWTEPSTFVQHHEEILGWIRDSESGFAHLVGDPGRGGNEEWKPEHESKDSVKLTNGWTARFEP